MLGLKLPPENKQVAASCVPKHTSDLELVVPNWEDKVENPSKRLKRI